jgi:hypothetical protein
MTLPKTKRNDITANRICVMDEFEDAIFLHACCSCGHEDHQQTLEVEVSDGDINLTIYSKIVTSYIHEPSYDCTRTEKLEYHWKDWSRRIKWILSIVFKGYVEAENVFSFHGSEQIDDYLDAISRAKNQLWLEQERSKKKIVQPDQDSIKYNSDSIDGC